MIGAAGRGAAALKTIMRHPAVKAAMSSLAAGLSSTAIEAYRKAHATMDPRTERKLAKAQTVLEIVASLAGLRAGKRGAAAAAPKTFAAIASFLKTTGNAAAYYVAEAGKHIPAAIARPAGQLKRAYDAITSVTGNEIPALAALWKSPEQILRARTLKKWADEARKQSTSIFNFPSSIESQQGLVRLGETLDKRASAAIAQAIKGYIGAALAGATAAGVTGYEEATIRRRQKEIADAWAKGEPFTLEPDTQPMPYWAQAIIGATGNPVEKIAVRLPVAGRFTRDLTDVAAYQAAYDGIAEAERAGTMTAAAAEKAREKLAERKPWNMAGSGIYAIQPAAAGLIRYATSKLSQALNTGHQYGTIETDTKKPGVTERDGDTILLKDGTRVRLLGGDTTEIPHGGRGSVQPLAAEATARAKQLAPDGTAVRIVAGGPEDRLDPNPKKRAGDFEADKRGRTLAYVESIPALVAKIPGLRRVWPGTDVMGTLIDEGLAQPRYDYLGSEASRLKDYHAAAAKAYEAGRGLYSPEATKALERGGLYRWIPTDRDAPAPAISGAMNIGGSGLLISGNTGLFRALGEKTGGAVAQAWNAALAIGGAAQNKATGPKNTGKKYTAPKGYPTDYEKKQAARRRSRNAAP